MTFPSSGEPPSDDGADPRLGTHGQGQLPQPVGAEPVAARHDSAAMRARGKGGGLAAEARLASGPELVLCLSQLSEPPLDSRRQILGGGLEQLGGMGKTALRWTAAVPESPSLSGPRPGAGWTRSSFRK